MSSDKQITIIKKEINPLITEADKFQKITSQTELIEATELLSKMNKIIDRVKEEKEKITKPLNEALKAERNRWKPIETGYEQAIEIIRKAMSDYQTEQVRIQKEEELKIAKRIGEGKGKLKIDTAIAKINEITKPEKEIASTEGLVQFRETPTLKITDEMAIPREYLTINEKKLLEALKSGQKVPGAEIEIIQIPVNYR